MTRILIAAAVLFPWSLLVLFLVRWMHRRHCTRRAICRICSRKEISRV